MFDVVDREAYMSPRVEKGEVGRVPPWPVSSYLARTGGEHVRTVCTGGLANDRHPCSLRNGGCAMRSRLAAVLLSVPIVVLLANTPIFAASFPGSARVEITDPAGGLS